MRDMTVLFVLATRQSASQSSSKWYIYLYCCLMHTLIDCFFLYPHAVVLTPTSKPDGKVIHSLYFEFLSTSVLVSLRQLSALLLVSVLFVSVVCEREVTASVLQHTARFRLGLKV